MRFAIKFAYDGRAFHGFARQPKLKTVEGDIIKSLVEKDIIKDTKESVFRLASRTDKGVSALGNVVAFNTIVSKKEIINSLSNENSLIIFYGVKDVDSDFNPRFAKLRQYRYYIINNGLDFEKIISASACFTGKHNFTNFARIEPFKDPNRTIDNIIFTLDSGFIIIDFYAQTFLWHQIRRIISALVKVGLGKLTIEQIIDALDNFDKKVDFGLAPAEQLILKDVFYDFEFEYNKYQYKRINQLEKNIISLL